MKTKTIIRTFVIIMQCTTNSNNLTHVNQTGVRGIHTQMRLTAYVNVVPFASESLNACVRVNAYTGPHDHYCHRALQTRARMYVLVRRRMKIDSKNNAIQHVSLCVPDSFHLFLLIDKDFGFCTAYAVLYTQQALWCQCFFFASFAVSVSVRKKTLMHPNRSKNNIKTHTKAI